MSGHTTSAPLPETHPSFANLTDFQLSLQHCTTHIQPPFGICIVFFSYCICHLNSLSSHTSAHPKFFFLIKYCSYSLPVFNKPHPPTVPTNPVFLQEQGTWHTFCNCPLLSSVNALEASLRCPFIVK